MFTMKPPIENVGLEEAIDIVLHEMKNHTSDSNEYARAVDQLTKLYAIKNLNRSKSVSADTLAIVIGNLVGILVIVGHERANVVTSKALNFILKLR